MQRRDKAVARMREPTRLVLLRHGETDWNVSKRLQGQLTAPAPPQLTAAGLRQAERAAAHLAARLTGVTAIVSSDLKRAAQVRRSRLRLGGVCQPLLPFAGTSSSAVN